MDRITVLNAVPDERFGGPQQRILQVARKLKEQGIDTIVLMPRGDMAYAGLLDEAGIQNIRLRSFRRLPNPQNLVGVFLWLWYFFPCVFLVMRMLHRYKVDIVHVNGAKSVQIALAAKLAGVKVLWHLNDVRNSTIIKPFSSLLLRILPDRIATASSAVARRYFGEDSPGRSVVLYPPVDTEKFHTDSSRVETYRTELEINGDEKVVGIVGNLTPVKGYEYFFRAAAIIRSSFPGVKFLVVGARVDTQERYWKKLEAVISKKGISDNVIMTGHRSDVFELMNVMDVFVISSVLEAAPIVVLEAMSCARPVVGTCVGGIPEMIVDGETGILVQPKDPEAIADKVLYLMNQPEKAEEMGRKGQKRVREHFGLSSCVSNHERIYRGLLQENA